MFTQFLLGLLIGGGGALGLYLFFIVLALLSWMADGSH